MIISRRKPPSGEVVGLIHGRQLGYGQNAIGWTGFDP
jgi:hypothetical protein